MKIVLATPYDGMNQYILDNHCSIRILLLSSESFLDLIIDFCTKYGITEDPFWIMRSAISNVHYTNRLPLLSIDFVFAVFDYLISKYDHLIQDTHLIHVLYMHDVRTMILDSGMINAYLSKNVISVVDDSLHLKGIGLHTREYVAIGADRYYSLRKICELLKVPPGRFVHIDGKLET